MMLDVLKSLTAAIAGVYPVFPENVKDEDLKAVATQGG